MPGSQKDPPDAVSKFSSLWCDISGQAPVRHTQHERETKGSNQQIINITSTKRIYRNNRSLCVYNKKGRHREGGKLYYFYTKCINEANRSAPRPAISTTQTISFPSSQIPHQQIYFLKVGKNAIQQFKWHVTNHWLGIRRDPLPLPILRQTTIGRSVGSPTHGTKSMQDFQNTPRLLFRNLKF